MPLYLDYTTLKDLSIFESSDGNSIFSRFNHTRTQGGERYLQRYFLNPMNDVTNIQAVQSLIATFVQHFESWPTETGNGTVFMMEKFLKYRFSPFKEKIHFLDRVTYMLTARDDYSMLKFSAKVFGDFFRGINKINAILCNVFLPVQYRFIQDKINSILQEEPVRKLANTKSGHVFTSKEVFYYGFHLRCLSKEIHDVMDVYFRLEAWFSMAKSVKIYNLSFPELIECNTPYFDAKQLYHLMVTDAKTCDVALNKQQKLMFLTGSNMAGKSTLIKAIGLSVYLSHLGMGVPAASLKISTFEGLLTNINIADDVTKGQSYFFNEVLRVKDTIGKIKSGKRWMILVDELFKGTNIIDAMQCSIDVIDGFSKAKNALFVISTHLYEIADSLHNAENVTFKHMQTIVDGDRFRFTYKLIDGVSNDRIGHRIMKQEGVIKMLQDL